MPELLPLTEHMVVAQRRVAEAIARDGYCHWYSVNGNQLNALVRRGLIRHGSRGTGEFFTWRGPFNDQEPEQVERTMEVAELTDAGRAWLARNPEPEAAPPCVGSGFCCKQAPCPFGEWDDARHQCRHLIPILQKEGLHERYTCAIAGEIVKQPGWEAAPAFGAGCCSSLFNPDRDAILRDIADAGEGAADALTKHHSQHLQP